MAELFAVAGRTISERPKKFHSGELNSETVIRKFRIVQTEGKRKVARMVEFLQSGNDPFRWLPGKKPCGDTI